MQTGIVITIFEGGTGGATHTTVNHGGRYYGEGGPGSAAPYIGRMLSHAGNYKFEC